MWNLGGHDSVRGRELIHVRHQAPSTGNTLQIKSADHTCEYVCTHIALYSLQSSLTLIIFPTWSLLAALWGRLLPDEKTQERLGHLPKSRALKSPDSAHVFPVSSSQVTGTTFSKMCPLGPTPRLPRSSQRGLSYRELTSLLWVPYLGVSWNVSDLFLS